MLPARDLLTALVVGVQRNKHFQCTTCHKKLTTATALKTHMLYVHKEEITAVPNAKPGRDDFNFDIIGMDNVPPHPAPPRYPRTSDTTVHLGTRHSERGVHPGGRVPTTQHRTI